MIPGALPRDPDAVLTAADVSDGQGITPDDVDLGELSRVVATVIDDEAVLYGEFEVDGTAVEDRDPEEAPPRGSALSGIVEDWSADTYGTVTLSAYIYVQTPEQGSLGVTLRESLEALSTIRAQYLE